MKPAPKKMSAQATTRPLSADVAVAQDERDKIHRLGAMRTLAFGGLLQRCREA